MQIATFKQMIMRSKAGKRICYHAGEVALDRLYNPDVDACARLAIAMHELGLCAHYIKRAHGVTEYWIVLMRKMRRTESRISFEDAEGTSQL